MAASKTKTVRAWAVVKGSKYVVAFAATKRIAQKYSDEFYGLRLPLTRCTITIPAKGKPHAN